MRQREHATGTCSRLPAAWAVFLAGLEVDAAGDSCRRAAEASIASGSRRAGAGMSSRSQPLCFCLIHRGERPWFAAERTWLSKSGAY